jgi:hypothetical protein
MPDRNRFNDEGFRRQRLPEAPNNDNNDATQRQQQFRQFQDRSINARPLTNVPQQRPQPTMLQQDAPPIQRQAPPPRMAPPPVQTAPPPQAAPMPVTAPPPLHQADAPRPIEQQPVTNFRQRGFGSAAGHRSERRQGSVPPNARQRLLAERTATSSLLRVRR